jgi:hypothetical protein
MPYQIKVAGKPSWLRRKTKRPISQRSEKVRTGQPEISASL